MDGTYADTLATLPRDVAIGYGLNDATSKASEQDAFSLLRVGLIGTLEQHPLKRAHSLVLGARGTNPPIVSHPLYLSPFDTARKALGTDLEARRRSALLPKLHTGRMGTNGRL